jgi:hypothetical protein
MKKSQKIRKNAKIKNNVIIVYQGRRGHLPFAACQLHLNQQIGSRHDLYAEGVPVPLSVVGIDPDGNTVCSLACGKHSDIYSRAIEGMAEIFDLDVELINVDQSLERNYSAGSNYLKHMAVRFCPQLCKDEWIKEELRSVVKLNITGDGR